MKNSTYDFIIIGAGVVGSMIARWLSRYQAYILLIDKEADIGMGATAANSAIVHPGYDPQPGSLKALTNVRANPMWDQLSAELNFAFQRPGDFVVAIGEQELPILDTLYQQGVKNGVPGMKIISAAEMLEREPLINPEVSGALWASTGGICDPFQVTVAAAENAVLNGAEVLLETEFLDFLMEGSRVVGVRTNRGDFFARWVINAAGIYADAVMHKAGVRPEFVIKPRRGEYFVLDSADIRTRNIYFPVPTEKGKGILVTNTVHGNTIIGPNANIIDDKEDTSCTRDGLEEISQGARKLIPSIRLRTVIGTFAGLRPMGNARSQNPAIDYGNDFVIEIPQSVQGLVNLGGIESPGLTAAPAIAEMVVDLLKDAGEKLVEKKGWDPIRPARPRFRTMSHAQRQALCAADPAYGRVICRCENVTEGEIVREIHAPIPATTYDAIKRRTWLGTGRCQGGFDMSRVVTILSRELGISLLEVTKRGGGSEFLFRQTKDKEAQDAA
ncbi:MAG: NAD(P)/FAD-dependent oxidoreductase [Chloroflexi bacterium]|jgi:glycerol-3-phosphate dehydrogenase|nr:NAD(P)/FAD-dependent oxidoreductase [Chloroflexota bacterium]